MAHRKFSGICYVKEGNNSAPKQQKYTNILRVKIFPLHKGNSLVGRAYRINVSVYFEWGGDKTSTVESVTLINIA